MSPTALVEAFGDTLSFGTGGVRALLGLGTRYINRYTVGVLTQGLSAYLRSLGVSNMSVCIGYDGRHQSAALARATAQVLLGNQVRVRLFERACPTPLVSFAVRDLGCTMGVMITASHNPAAYNGYKVYTGEGAQLVSPADEALTAAMEAVSDLRMVRWGDAAEAEILGDEVDARYLAGVHKWLAAYGMEDGVGDSQRLLPSVLYTPLHGVGSRLIPPLFADLGVSLSLVRSQSALDGDFPTVAAPNPEEEGAWSAAIAQAAGTDIGVIMATDADADRLGVAVRTTGGWERLTGNQLGCLLFDFILSRLDIGLAGRSFVVKTLVSSPLLGDIAGHYGVRCYDTLTGFKHIAEVISRHHIAGEAEFVCAAEESYGYLVGGLVRDKDAIGAAAVLVRLLQGCTASGLLERLYALYRRHGLYYDTLYTLTLSGEVGSEQIAACMARNRACPPAYLGDLAVVSVRDYTKVPIGGIYGDVLQFEAGNALDNKADHVVVSLRPSGTEPKLKLYISVRVAWDERPYMEQKAALAERAVAYYRTILGDLYPNK